MRASNSLRFYFRLQPHWWHEEVRLVTLNALPERWTLTMHSEVSFQPACARGSEPCRTGAEGEKSRALELSYLSHLHRSVPSIDPYNTAAILDLKHLHLYLHLHYLALGKVPFKTRLDGQKQWAHKKSCILKMACPSSLVSNPNWQPRDEGLYAHKSDSMYLFLSPASQRLGTLNPWIWRANRARSSGLEHRPLQNVQLFKLFVTALKVS